jgi:hypothetical protein
VSCLRAWRENCSASKKAIDGAVENDNLYIVVGFQRRDDLVQLRDGLGPKDIQGRMVERHSPIKPRPPFETDLFVIFHAIHVASKIGTTSPRSPRQAPRSLHQRRVVAS